MSTIAFEYPVVKLTYKTVGERQLSLYMVAPLKKGANRPAILFFNGGSFSPHPSLNPAQFQHQADYFSTLGMAAICVDYRNGADTGFAPEQAIKDAKSAVRWVRDHCEELGVDPDRIAMCGASAGGYVAVSSIMFDHLDDDADGKRTNTVPNALVVFAAGMDGVDIMDRLFPDLRDKALAMSPLHQIRRCLPPTLWMCGSSDGIFEQNRTFVERMIQAGNRIDFIAYEGMEHGFFNYGRHENQYYYETRSEMERFLASTITC
ncbi:alpha/beta hydrolase [Cohnella panacarvi]|uniref:alpha/beta hydrolase n=1 Tax=Cohnella panacarvi TaxID=400776 RepID=UPI00047C5184|nr:alpha/beta hydrolase fold domain-containing protein [Cohnella panacarvi]